MDSLLTTVDRMASRLGRLNAVVDWVADKVSPHATAQATCPGTICNTYWGADCPDEICVACELWEAKRYYVYRKLPAQSCTCWNYTCEPYTNTHQNCAC